MILPERLDVPPMGDTSTREGREKTIMEINFATGWNSALDAVEKVNMKPDGHYWDHTSKTYRDMLTSKEPEAPHAS